MEFNISDFHLKTPIQIRFNDVDGLGHVNNSTIMEYFDLGRLEYINKSLGDRLGRNGENVVIVSYKTDFFSQVLLNDQIIVYTKVYKLGNKSFRMLQYLVKENNSTPIASCDSVLSGINMNDNCSMIIPEEWRQCFNKLENGNLLKI